MKYKIDVIFNKVDDNNIIFEGKSYYGENSFDNIKISNNGIEIVGDRVNNTNLEAILNNTQSSFYKQILKALVFAYITTGVSYNISKIKLYKWENEREEYIEENIIQPFTKCLDEKYFVKKEMAQTLFTSSKKSDMLLNAAILFIKGFQEDNFDYYWKSFNCLYTEISGKNKEFEKLKHMRNFIENNTDVFISTFELIDEDKKEDIRKLRIREFVLNEFETENETKQYKDFIIRFRDFRLIELFEEILPYRKEFLVENNFFEEVQAHINKYKSRRLKLNTDLLCFYVLKYSYYLRNKYFHAEKTAPVFILKENNEIIELNKINQIMCTFLIDLFNSSKIYAQVTVDR